MTRAALANSFYDSCRRDELSKLASQSFMRVFVERALRSFSRSGPQLTLCSFACNLDKDRFQSLANRVSCLSG